MAPAAAASAWGRGGLDIEAPIRCRSRPRASPEAAGGGSARRRWRRVAATAARTFARPRPSERPLHTPHPSESAPTTTGPALGRGVGVALGVGVAIVVAHTLWLSATRPFALDELTYAHAAGAIAGGALPYRDFFAHHPPLLWQLLAPLHGVVESAGAFLVLARAALCVVWLAQLGLLWHLARSALPQPLAPLAALAPLTAGLLQTWADHAIELRPDGLALTLTLASFALLTTRRDGVAATAGRALAAGLAIVAACWASPKAAVVGSPLLLLWLASLRTPAAARGATRPIAHPAAFLAGAALGVAGIAGWITAHDLWQPLHRWMIAWPLAYEASYRGFPFWLWLGPSVQGAEGLLLLAALGWLVALARAGRAILGGGEPVGVVGSLLALGPPMALVSVAMQSAAYPYSFLPLLAEVALLVSVGVAAAWTRLQQPDAPALARRLAPVVWVVLLVLAGLRAFDPSTRPPLDKRRGQLAVLADVERLVPPEVPVYDNSGSSVRRPAVHFYGFTNPWVREHERALLEREIPAAMQAKGCTAMLVDSATHALPPAIAAFVAAHFQPWDADLWLWARQLPGGGNALRAHDVAIWRAGGRVRRRSGCRHRRRGGPRRRAHGDGASAAADGGFASLRGRRPRRVAALGAGGRQRVDAAARGGAAASARALTGGLLLAAEFGDTAAHVHRCSDRSTVSRSLRWATSSRTTKISASTWSATSIGHRSSR